MWRELQPDDPGRIGPYLLRGVVGSGGMGRVFLGASADGRLAIAQCLKDSRLAWISGGGWVCG